jgi:hypothetical protein
MTGMECLDGERERERERDRERERERERERDLASGRDFLVQKLRCTRERPAASKDRQEKEGKGRDGGERA